MKMICISTIFLLQFLNMFGQDISKSKIIIYRPHIFQGYLIPFKVKVNDSLIVKIRDNSYYEFICKPGDYNFTFVKYKNSKLHLLIENGKTYYLRLGINIGFWSSSPELLLVDSISAYPMITNPKIQKLKSNYEILIRPKNRIGANVISGSGFGGYAMFENAKGTKSVISFGSGFGYEFEYGRELNKWVDISFEYKHQKSFLSPSVDSADVSFERKAISITPSLIIPINDGDYMRVKLGLGFDYVWPSLLVLNTVNYPNGIYDNWTYKETYGMHIVFIYEVNFTKYLSFQYGIRWNNLSYQFTKGNNYYPINDELIHPDGSGLDFIFGLNIHF